MHFVKAREVEIAAIHDVNRAWLQQKLVEDIDVVNLAIGDNDRSRNVSAQIQKRVEFDRAFAFAKLRPGKQRQTQIDCVGIERIDRFVQLHSEIVVGMWNYSSNGSNNICGSRSSMGFPKTP